MTIRPIIRYPDRRLAIPARPVTAFDDALRELATDLLETMRAAPGIGITAPHIGVPLRVVVLELDARNGPRTYVNPEIEWTSPEMILHREGSVSMPGVNDDVQRHARVRISYWDLDGNMQSEESEALRAVCHPDGGTAYILYRKDRFECSQGAELLRPYKLKETSRTNRVVAKCCNSAMFMNFDRGPQWVSAYRSRFRGELPPLQHRICTKFKPDGVVLPDDVPSSRGFPPGFAVKLLASRIAMALGRP